MAHPQPVGGGTAVFERAFMARLEGAHAPTVAPVIKAARSWVADVLSAARSSRPKRSPANPEPSPSRPSSRKPDTNGPRTSRGIRWTKGLGYVSPIVEVTRAPSTFHDVAVSYFEYQARMTKL